MEMKKTITVAVCGTQPRIGTTTQALQLTAYLQMMGYTTAYVELADQGFIDQMRKLYCDVSVDGTCVKYERLHLYESIVDVNGGEPYEFLIKDYGAMNQDAFNKISYLEQDIQVICGGVKPNEIFTVNEILKKAEYDSAKIIFNFTPSDQKTGILSMMKMRASDTFFANYNPDPFSYDSTMNKTYRTIMGAYMTGAAMALPGKRKIGKEQLCFMLGWMKQVYSRKSSKWIALAAYTIILCYIFIHFFHVYA